MQDANMNKIQQVADLLYVTLNGNNEEVKNAHRALDDLSQDLDKFPHILLRIVTLENTDGASLFLYQMT